MGDVESTACGADAADGPSRGVGMLIHTPTATAAAVSGMSQPTAGERHQARRGAGGVVLAIAASSA
jgi:hypothetical protein